MKLIAACPLIVSCLCFGTLAGCSPSKSGEQSTPPTTTQVGNNQTSQPSVVPTSTGEGAEKQEGGVASAGQAADELHTPPKGSAERQSLMDGLREEYKKRRNGDGKPFRGNITFVVNYLEVHNGWAWVFADPNSSDPQDQFGENSGFLLHQEDGQWKVKNLPPMVDDPDDPENLDYPSPKDVQSIRKMYPSTPADIFPKQR
jgi:hypothetical protein